MLLGHHFADAHDVGGIHAGCARRGALHRARSNHRRKQRVRQRERASRTGGDAAGPGARRREDRRGDRLRARPAAAARRRGAIHALGTAVPIAVRKPPRFACLCTISKGASPRVNAACVRLDRVLRRRTRRVDARDLIAPKGKYNHDGIRAAMERGETTEFERLILTKSGSIRIVDGRRVPLHVDGKVRGYCGMFRDITEERRVARNSRPSRNAHRGVIPHRLGGRRSPRRRLRTRWKPALQNRAPNGRTSFDSTTARG